MKKYHKSIRLLLLMLVCIWLVSCADVEPVQECLQGYQYGFFSGLLHGFITPASFLGSLFDDNIAIYAVNNTGGVYDLGFLVGSSGWGFMVGNRSKKS